MPTLDGEPVSSAGDLRETISWGDLRERYDVDGFTVYVDDPAEAERLVEENPHLSFADGASGAPAEPDATRATATTDGVEFSDECSVIIERTGEPCGRDRPCPYHDE